MSLIDRDLAEIGAVLSAALHDGGIGSIITELRHRMPGLVCMGCDASDVLEEPYRSYAGIDLHLIDTRSHCAEMTSDPRRASGVLLARKMTA